MVLLLYDVMNVKGRGMKKAPALAHGAWRTESSYLHCHTPARALKIALDASVAEVFTPTTTGGLWLREG